MDPPTDVTPLAFATSAEADAWFDAERDNLVAATRVAAGAGAPQIAWKLAAMLHSVFMHQNAFESWFVTARIGLAVARTLGDRRGEAEALGSLGKAHFQARQLPEAAEHHRAALGIRREIGDEYGTAVSIDALGLLGLRHRHLTESLTYFGESLAIFERLGNHRWQALLLSNLAETRCDRNGHRDRRRREPTVAGALAGGVRAGAARIGSTRRGAGGRAPCGHHSAPAR